MNGSGQATARAIAKLESEQSIVRCAVELVARGRSTRVVCVGLAFAGQLLDAARVDAARAGVLVEPVWTLDDQPTGLTVSRVADA